MAPESTQENGTKTTLLNDISDSEKIVLCDRYIRYLHKDYTTVFTNSAPPPIHSCKGAEEYIYHERQHSVGGCHTTRLLLPCATNAANRCCL